MLEINEVHWLGHELDSVDSKEIEARNPASIRPFILRNIVNLASHVEYVLTLLWSGEIGFSIRSMNFSFYVPSFRLCFLSAKSSL